MEEVSALEDSILVNRRRKDEQMKERRKQRKESERRQVLQRYDIEEDDGRRKLDNMAAANALRTEMMKQLKSSGKQPKVITLF